MTVFTMASFGLCIAASIIFDFSVIYALLFGCVCFYAAAASKGFSPKSILTMMFSGVRSAAVVLMVFIFIGLLTGAWRASGTVQFFVYWGTRLIPARWFVPGAFLITCMVSYLLGTAFGTCGTIGVVLMVLAEAAGVSLPLTAGAVISGAFFGDRCAPTSSSNSLVAQLTGTTIVKNLPLLIKTSVIPFAATALLYALMSAPAQGSAVQGDMLSQLTATYSLSPLTALPAVIVLVLPLFKLDIKPVMLISTLAACAIAMALQGESFPGLVHALITGYSAPFEGILAPLMAGGGLISMAKAGAIVAVTSTYSGIIRGAGLFNGLDGFFCRLSGKIGIFAATLLTSIGVSVFSTNQTLSIMLTHQLTEKASQSLTPSVRAVNLANSATLTAPLIPWNIACAVPLSLLGATAAAVPYSFYLYAVPLFALGDELIKSMRKKRSTKLGAK